MTDALLAAVWMALLASVLVGCAAARKLGAPVTYLRDLLHVGAGIWVLGWPAWRSLWPPVAIACGAALGTALVPALARRVRVLSALLDAVSGGDERWTGLTLYALAYAETRQVTPKRVQLHFVGTGITGEAEVGADHLARAAERVREASAGIRSARFPPQPDPRRCSYCPYSRFCIHSAARGAP